ncbi:cobalt ECF transporter T component CbiQ [Methanothermococcus sp.]|uniref:cobalt ECF transporter T component CbiQ n=1 Tax=Methanothermococcus sp. TaxID=2614238 RepID=UPI0025DB6D0E|nr:cobalt ECF transporter T component CbiQ [Methanothermococcus sp.]
MKLFDKTIEGVIKYINEAVFAEKYAKSRGILQSINPKIKLIVILSFVVITVLTKHLEVIFGLYVLSLIFCYFSNVPLKHYLKRVWFFIPIFTGIIALPIIFITPGKPIYVLLNSPYIAITYEGIYYATIFTLRVATAVSYAVLLTITTTWNDITKSLNKLGIPDMVITIMTIAYRYIFLLMNTLIDSMYSRKSRLCKNLGMKESWIEAGKNMGALFIKTHQMGEDLYYAMLSRGYLNEPQTYSEFHTETKDYIFLIISIFIMAIAIIIDRCIL